MAAENASGYAEVIPEDPTCGLPTTRKECSVAQAQLREIGEIKDSSAFVNPSRHIGSNGRLMGDSAISHSLRMMVADLRNRVVPGPTCRPPSLPTDLVQSKPWPLRASADAQCHAMSGW